jgi:hypothetical protein
MGAEGTPGRIALRAVAGIALAALTFWLVRPGGPFRGPEPLSTSLVFSSVEGGRFVYRLLEPPTGQARLVATLQSVYDVHKPSAGGGSVSVVLLRRSADVTPFVTGGWPSSGRDILAVAVAGPEGREAVVRPAEDAPLRPARLRW